MDRLDPRLREELLALGPRRDYRAGQRLLMEGAATTHVFLIVTGVVKVTATAKERGPAVLAMRHEGDLVGELAAMDGSPRSASVVACRQVTAHEIGRAAFLAFRDRPGVSPVVSSTVNDRLLSEACRSAGIDRGHWHRQPQGDGEFAPGPDGLLRRAAGAALAPAGLRCAAGGAQRGAGGGPCAHPLRPYV